MAPWAAFKAVVSAAFGVRRGGAAREDAKLGIGQIVVAALLAMALLIALLLLLVKWLVSGIH